MISPDIIIYASNLTLENSTTIDSNITTGDVNKTLNDTSEDSE